MTLKPGDTPEPEKRQKRQKKAKKGQKPATFYIWQIARNERENKMNEIEKNPEYLTYALISMPSVLTAEYCYPNFWAIETKQGHFDLGTANGNYGWNSEDGQIVGETDKETIAGVCLAFEQFLVNLNNEGKNK